MVNSFLKIKLNKLLNFKIFFVKLILGFSNNVNTIPQFLTLLARYDNIPRENGNSEANGHRRWESQNPRPPEERMGRTSEGTSQRNQQYGWDSRRSQPREWQASSQQRDGRRDNKFRGEGCSQRPVERPADQHRGQNNMADTRTPMRERESPVNSMMADENNAARKIGAGKLLAARHDENPYMQRQEDGEGFWDIPNGGSFREEVGADMG